METRSRSFPSLINTPGQCREPTANDFVLMLKNISVSLAALLLTASPLLAGVKLASPFTSHMVLQRDMKVPVWGTADAGERVTGEFAVQKISGEADAEGTWRVNLKPDRKSTRLNSSHLGIS